MQGSRFSGILTVGIVAFGVLWYFNSGSGEESAPNVIESIDTELPAEAASAPAEIVPTRFSPDGSRILSLGGEDLSVEMLQNGAWNPVFDSVESWQEAEIGVLQTNADELGDETDRATSESMIEGVVRFNALRRRRARFADSPRLFVCPIGRRFGGHLEQWSQGDCVRFQPT